MRQNITSPMPTGKILDALSRATRRHASIACMDNKGMCLLDSHYIQWDRSFWMCSDSDYNQVHQSIRAFVSSPVPGLTAPLRDCATTLAPEPNISRGASSRTS